MRIALILLLLSACPTLASAQGCVAIRGFTSCSPSLLEKPLERGDWRFSTNYRYFESFRHFRGTEEEEDRLIEQTEVINYTTQVSISVDHRLDQRRSINFTLPYNYFVRSSLYEHGRTERHTSRANGIGDVRIGFSQWLWHPDSVSRGNLALGVGLKLPTGDFNARDFFYNVGADEAGEYRPVDQSIQPGDGGLGVTLELQGHVLLAKSLAVYANAFYLLNPMETNGTRTYRETLSPILQNEAIMSIADQYMARLGLNWRIAKSGVSMFFGGRIEGIPVKDLVGGSDGFRRPGYALSLEPGLDWMRGRHDLNISAPVAVRRERFQSLTDKENSDRTGTYRHGDAAFADWLLNVTWSVRLGAGTMH